ncbi:phospholipid carrier-dependent glycosyltransferase [Telmatocola sphagniphila]|uniref:Phospholipid carrier-dependent glycosyltransferase n=1 Tax=Telmatocola sphagniphila TaxID=1123043 RepID=A0A8E6B974_9BACT|nr:phospholipid carrier-dependent glycosyltransferase [Telmatocola sphagniphila]QVL33719.1 phospholipid carrier-dependent glycosyltransferase [Telmatocola sphagniphila]
MKYFRSLAVVIWIATCLFFFLYRAQVFIESNSATFDEGVHLSAGYSYWSRGDFRLNHETPPLSKLIASLPLYLFKHLPFQPTGEQWDRSDMWNIANDFLFRSALPPQEVLAWGRWSSVPVGLALVVLIGWWSYRLFGLLAGCFCLGLACSEPNLLAFSCIINSDMCLTLFTFASTYCSWEYFRKPGRFWFILSGVAIGLSLASKFSALFFLPGLFVCWIILLYRRKNISPAMTPFTALFRLCLIATLALLPCYFFFQFPQFGQGLKQQLVRNNFDPPEFYLMGEISTRGWYHYFLTTFYLKQTPALQLATFLIVCSLITAASVQVLAKVSSMPDWLFLLVPPLLFFGLMSFLRVDLGIRIILPVIALHILVCGVLLCRTVFTRNRRFLSITCWIGLISLLLGVDVYFGFRLRGLELAYQLQSSSSDFTKPYGYDFWETLGDSNLDWGQDLIRLKNWMAANDQKSIYLAYIGTAPAEAYGIDFIPLPAWGRLAPWPEPQPDAVKPNYVAISVSCLQGLHLKDHEMYRWLLEFEPVTRLGLAIWVYDLRDKPKMRERIERLAEQVAHAK